MIESGAAGGSFCRDQLSSAKKCGHLGRVWVPAQAVIKLVAALAADVIGTSSINHVNRYRCLFTN